MIGYGFAPVQLGEDWQVWLYGLLVYEFWYWLQHYLAHKVRLLWCLHSPHHAPKTMNMFVGFNHHVLESQVYFPLFLGLIPGLCGVPPHVLLIIILLDQSWGSFLHVNADVVKGRYGALEYLLQTPSYHRVHHAQNVRYLDSNYNSITLFWDWVFGTRQPLRNDEAVDYGITREVDDQSFRDVQFGEFKLLWRDMQSAPKLRDKLNYLLRPPGWSHIGEHKTAAVMKAQRLKSAGI